MSSISVKIICENKDCKNCGKQVNRVHGFCDEDAAHDFVEQFSESHDRVADSCRKCGELGIAYVE